MLSSSPVEVVQQYAARGWRVLPCHSAPDGKCSCGKDSCHASGKHPRTPDGYKNATVDEGQIGAWAAQLPRCNWGVATGQESGLFVLDVDGEDGQRSLEALEAEHGSMPSTRISTTGRGKHLWFRYPPNHTIRSSQNKLGARLDIRADGALVIVPPSIHRTGIPYRWIDESAPIISAPDWLLKLIGQTSQTRLIHHPDREPTLFREGCSLRGRGAEYPVIELRLLQMNRECCDPPHDDSKVREIAKSICDQYPPGPIRVNASQPLPEFLQLARLKNNLEFMDRNPRGKWHSALFTFTRHVKGRPEFSGLDAFRAAQRIEQEIGIEFWEQFSYVHNDPKVQFIFEWDAVRTPAGNSDALTLAWAEALQCPMLPPKSYSASYNQCVSLFAALQRRAGDGKPFIGPQERIGDLFKVHPTTVGHYIRLMIGDKIASLAKKYERQKLAAEYTIDLSKLTPASSVPSLPESPETPEQPRTTKTHQRNQDSTGASGDSGDSGKNDNRSPSGELPIDKEASPTVVIGR